MKNTIVLTIGLIIFLLGATSLVYVFSIDNGSNSSSQTIYSFDVDQNGHGSYITLRGGLSSLNMVEIDEEGIPQFDTDMFRFDFRGSKFEDLQIELDSTYDWYADLICPNCDQQITEKLTLFTPVLSDYESITSREDLYYYSNGSVTLEKNTVNVLTDKFDWSKYENEIESDSTFTDLVIPAYSPLTLIAHLDGEVIIEVIPALHNTQFDIDISKMNNKIVYSSQCTASQIKDLDHLDIDIKEGFSKPIRKSFLKQPVLKEYFYVDPSCAAGQRINDVTFFDDIDFDTSLFERSNNDTITQVLEKGVYKIRIYSKESEKVELVRINTKFVGILTELETYESWNFYYRNNPIQVTPTYELDNGRTYSSKKVSVDDVNISSDVPAMITGPILFTSAENYFDPFAFHINTYEPDIMVADHLQKKENDRTTISLPIGDFVGDNYFSIQIRKNEYEIPDPIEGDLTLDDSDVSLTHRLLVPSCEGDFEGKFDTAMTSGETVPFALLDHNFEIGSRSTYTTSLIGEHKLLIRSEEPPRLSIKAPNNVGAIITLSKVIEKEEVLCDRVFSQQDHIEINCDSNDTNIYILRLDPSSRNQIFENIKAELPIDLFILDKVRTGNNELLYTNYSGNVLIEAGSNFFIQDPGKQEFPTEQEKIYHGPFFTFVQTGSPFILTPTDHRLPSNSYCTSSQADINKFYWIGLK